MADEDLTPSNIVSRALRDVPVTKYALALAAIVVLVAIARAVLPDVGISGMFPLICGVLILMVLLFVVAVIASEPGRVAGPATMITWAASCSLVVLMAASVTAVLFGEPAVWASLILPRKAVDTPLLGGGSPKPEVVNSQVESNGQDGADGSDGSIVKANVTNVVVPGAPVSSSGGENLPQPKVTGRILLRDGLGPSQKYERLKVFVNNYEKAVFSLDRNQKSQVFGFEVNPGDRYSLSGSEAVITPTGVEIRNLVGGGAFKSPLATSYHLRQGSLNGNVQNVMIVRDEN